VGFAKLVICCEFNDTAPVGAGMLFNKGINDASNLPPAGVTGITPAAPPDVAAALAGS
jgi:hypothetical protein